MTVEPQIPRIVYLANGTGTDFPVTFPYAAQSDIQVWVGIKDAEVLQTLGGAYTILGSSPNGIVHFAVAPPVNVRVSLVRNEPLRQSLDATNTGTIFPQNIVAALDRLERQGQDTSERVDRALILRPGSTATVPQLFVDEPAANGILRWNADATRVLSDAQLGSILVNARDQAVAAAAQAVMAAASALASAASASSDAASAAASATAAANAAVAAVNAAAQATAAQEYIASIAQKATFGLGLMGLANNLTQLLYVIVPFVRQVFDIFEDWGWIAVTPAVTEDDGWVCPGTGGDCVDYGLLSGTATEFLDYGLISAAFDETEDFGLIIDPAVCGGSDVVCTEDLGWVNSLIDLNPEEAIELPIRVPDPCPIIIVGPNPPGPGPDPDPDSASEEC